MKTIAITGARGYLARNFAKTLTARGFRVIGVSRRDGSLPDFTCVWKASLGDSLVPLFDKEPIAALLHCAEDHSDGAFDTNVNGTRKWLQEAHAHGVKTQVFFSTLIPEGGVESDYTRMKQTLEQDCLAHDAVIFRLGLVVGPGGMFSRITESLRKSPLVPLLDGGKAAVFVLGISYLCEVVGACVESDGEGLPARPWHLQQPTGYTLRGVMESIRRTYGYRCWFVPVPSLPILWMVSIVERLGVKGLPVSSTNLRGLRDSVNVVFPSEFEHFGHPEQDLDTLVACAHEMTNSENPGQADNV